jgi:hypothetical protein
MPRGRPVKSIIRQNIVEILYFMGKGYGYDIYKAYREIFAPVTMRSIYYHLNKGVQTEEFKIDEVKKEEGDYSWGSTVTKTYYALGGKAKAMINNQVKEYFDKKKEGKK